jgi:hypothetical protein
LLSTFFQEIPMPYEKCSEVNSEYWQELKQADPAAINRRTGVAFDHATFHLPFMNRELWLDLGREHILVSGTEDSEPDFLTCMTAILYLLRVDPSVLGAPVSPMELTGASTFFQARGPHALPKAPLENKFGSQPSAFLEAGQRLGAAVREAGDAALALQVFPGLTVEVILWEADEEFPAQASFTVPANLDRFFPLDAVLGLLQLVVKEIKAAARKAGV